MMTRDRIDSDQAFLGAFESCSLTRDDWDHAAHLRVAWMYLRRAGLEDAVARMREGIYRYDEGTDQICNYHETMTRFWMTRVAESLRGGPPDEGFGAFLDRNPALKDKHLILQYYSQPRVISDAARDGWVPPDLKPLDEPPQVVRRKAVDLT